MFYKICVTILGDASEKSRNSASCLYAKRRTSQVLRALSNTADYGKWNGLLE